jgi:2-isopropylmalate synthase
VQKVADETAKELSSIAIRQLFDQTYLESNGGLQYVDHSLSQVRGSTAGEQIAASMQLAGSALAITGAGNGPVDAMMRALQQTFGIDAHVQSYAEHSLSTGEDSRAVAYAQLRFGWDQSAYGVGIDENIVTAALKAIVSAINRGAALGMVTLASPAPQQKVANLR